MSLPLFARLIRGGYEEQVRRQLSDPEARTKGFKRSIVAGESQALLEACRDECNRDIVMGLLFHGADVRAQNHEPLRLAVNYANNDTIKALLDYGYRNIPTAERGADPVPRDILDMAIKVCSPESACGVLEYAETPDVVNLANAVECKPLAMLQALLERGAIPNGVPGHIESQRLPLTLAVYAEKLEHAELLLAHGADLHANDNEAVEIARRKGLQQFLILFERSEPPAVNGELVAAANAYCKNAAATVGSWF